MSIYDFNMNEHGELKEYKEGLRVKRSELYARYREGAVIIYQDCEDDEEEIIISAEDKYMVGFNEFRYRNSLNRKRSKYGRVPYRIMGIKPIGRSNIVTGGKIVISTDRFYTDYGSVLGKEMEDFNIAYDATPEDVKLYYHRDYVGGAVIYYGSSLDEVDLESLDANIEDTDDEIEVDTYQKYLEDKQKYVIFEERKRTNQAEEFEVVRPWDSNVSELTIVYKIKNWMKHYDYADLAEFVEARVCGQENLDTVLISIYTYLDNIANGRPHNNNMLLAAPSGCGKTETFRAIRDYFAKRLPELPVAQVDMTSITEEGFKGNDTKSLVEALLRKSETNGVGIIFMDEFDKKLIPSYTSYGSDVNGAVQNQLLTTIEGRIFINKDVEIDTNNTLFIGLGSFDECRRRKKKASKSIGFNSEEEVIDHYESITREDMLRLGAYPEMIGRFPLVINYSRLSTEIIDTIIDHTLEQLQQSIPYTIELTAKMRERLHESANSEYGCRMFMSMISNAVMPAYAKLRKERRRKGYYTIVVDDIDSVEVEKGRER